MESNIHPPRLNSHSYKNDSRPPNKYGSPSTSRVSSPSYPYFLSQPAKSKFIGSFIHEYAFDSRAKQRPSKRARQRIRKRLAKLELEDRGSKTSPESGYDTTSGDCQTPGLPSPEKRKFNCEIETTKRTEVKTTEKSSPSDQHNGKLPKENGEGVNNSHSRTTSVSSISSLISDKTLKKLLKDLHRCEVSIAKYEVMLLEKCDNGQSQLHEVFSNLRKYVNTREADLRQELTTVQNNAAAILERRKNTALYLKQAAEQVSNLEESQVAELKQQIKQFVTDRRVDEEIGTITRFYADPDDILPHIMGFGKVNRMRPLYTEWEENPEEAIEMSKHRLSFSLATLGSHRFSTSSISEVNSSPSHSVTSDPADTNTDHTLFEPPPVESADTPQEKETEEEKSEEHSPPSFVPAPKKVETMAKSQVTTNKNAKPKVTTNDRVPAKRPAATETKTNKNEQKPTKKEKSKVNRAAKTEVAKNEESTEKGSAEKEDGAESSDVDLAESDSCDKKISAAELILKQARVRESLKMQGVFLYNPITGEGPPPKPLPPSTPTEMMPTADHERSASPASRKKKTPTQLRRERKKRQRERERRQNELERKSRENSAKSNSSFSSSSECKTPDILTADKIPISGGEEDNLLKEEWSRVTESATDELENDASGESSEIEMATQPTEATASGETLSTITTEKESPVSNTADQEILTIHKSSPPEESSDKESNLECLVTVKSTPSSPSDEVQHREDTLTNFPTEDSRPTEEPCPSDPVSEQEYSLPQNEEQSQHADLNTTPSIDDTPESPSVEQATTEIPEVIVPSLKDLASKANEAANEERTSQQEHTYTKEANPAESRTEVKESLDKGDTHNHSSEDSELPQDSLTAEEPSDEPALTDANEKGADISPEKVAMALREE